MNLISRTYHSCERKEHVFRVLREYTIISLVCPTITFNGDKEKPKNPDTVLPVPTHQLQQLKSTINSISSPNTLPPEPKKNY